MDVRNCRSCHRLFNYLSGPDICPECRNELERKYEKVRDYIRDNKGANIPQVSEDTGVSQQLIKQWIREERLQFSKDSPVGIECETCGASIRTGRYCENCKKDMASTLSRLYNNDTSTPTRREKTGNRMRFLD